MSKFSEAFGKSYDKNKLSIISRTFELGNHKFKVRVPNVGELERIYNYASNPDLEKVEKAYQFLFGQGITGDNVVYTDDDVLVDGRSMREAAKNKVVMQFRITEYFKLLVPENDASLENLEYEDIEAEFPLAIQLEFIDKINEVISPEYKEAREK